MRADASSASAPPASAATEPATPPLPEGLRPGGRLAEWQRVPPAYVLLDVDGTLVGSGGQIAEEVAAAARRAVDAGLAVGVATGRGAGSVARLAEDFRVPGPHVVANGGQVVLDGQVVHADPLDLEVVEAVLDVADYAELYIGEEYYATDLRESAEAHWELLGHPPAGTVDDARRDPSVNLGAVAKLTVVQFGEEGDDAVVARLATLPISLGTSSSPVTPGLRYLNITTARADKGTALRAAADVLGIGVEATMAIGDERNDLSMLAVAGTAVAMGQSADPIHAGAHLITAAVDEHGAAVALDAAVALASEGAPTS